MYADCLPGARVTVSVAGEEALEYETENEPFRAVSFIEAIPGANFAVILDIERDFAYRNPQDCIKFKISLDGQGVKSNIISTHRQNVFQFRVDGVSVKTGNVTMLKVFQFAEHASTEAIAPKSALEKFSDVGEIKVELFRCRKMGKSKTSSQLRFEGIGEDAIPEKAFKGRSISSHTSLGPGEVVKASSHVKVAYPHGKAPIATYVFQYRTRKDLQVEGIIERSPSPVPLEERDPDELTPDELRELVRRSRAEKASAVKIKQEVKREKRAREHLDGSTSADEEGDVTIMSENNKRQRTRASMENAEVVDLSDD